jgi:hypothetical protein
MKMHVILILAEIAKHCQIVHALIDRTADLFPLNKMAQ